MKFFSRFPVFRFLFPFSAGIFVYLNNPASGFPYFLALAIIGYLASCWFTAGKLATGKHAQRWLAGFPFYSCFLGMGFLTALVHDTSRFTGHFETGPEKRMFLTECTAPSTSTSNGHRIILRVLAEKRCDDWHPVRGNLLLYISDTSKNSKVSTGDRLFLCCKPERIPAADLPGGFNAALYYAGKGCHYQGFVRGSDVLKTQHGRNGLFATADLLRGGMLIKIRDHVPDTASHGVAGALLLGFEDWLDPELETSFNSAGVLHILCVSGMHVMLVYMILEWLLGFMEKKWFSRHLKFLMLLFLIWFYAMLTGFSPSVLRAAAMVSFVMGGKWLGRNVSVYNLLCASCFLLFWMNPWLITSAGFQLSFLAVCGIVFIHPYIRLWWQPANTLLQKTWELISVSLSAQMATMPLSIWMFHQFPNYFLLGNLVLVPLSTLVMYSGMAMLSVSWVSVAADALGWITSKLILVLNAIVSFIGSLPGALTEDIFISTFGMILSYLMLIGLVLWLVFKHFAIFRVVLCFGILILGETVYRKVSTGNREQLLVIPGKGTSHFVFIRGTESLRIRGETLLPVFREKTMNNYLLMSGVDRPDDFILRSPGVYTWAQVGVTVVHDLNRSQRFNGSFPANPHFLIISGKAGNEMVQFAPRIHPGLVIIDRSVNSSLAVQLESEFNKKNVPVHRVTKEASVWALRGLK